MKDAKPLTDIRIRKAAHRDRLYRLYDGDGLCLAIMPAPSAVKTWQYRFTCPITGKPDTWTLGRYPAKSLAGARDDRKWAKKQLDDGKNPKRVRRNEAAEAKAAAENTFGRTADDWIEQEAKHAKWTDDYKEEVEASIKNHLAPLRDLPLADVLPKIALPLIRKVQRASPGGMAIKVRSRLMAVLDYAVEGGALTMNPIPRVRRRRVARNHYPAVTGHADVGAILRDMDAANACKGVKRAATLTVFIVQRIGEIVPGTWDGVDFEKAAWTIPRAQMKVKDPSRGDHVVPIPPALLAQMREWHRADGEDRLYICPSPRGDRQPVTRESVEKHFRRELNLAGKHSPHSWRTVFSTWAYDAGEDAGAIEAQLDHLTGSSVKTAYDRAKRVELRRGLMERHEQRLLAARDGVPVETTLTPGASVAPKKSVSKKKTKKPASRRKS